MKWHARRVTRQWLVALAIITGLVAVGLLLNGVSQPASAGVPSPLEDSYKLASTDKVSPGASFTYTIVLSNSSTSSVGPVTVTDALPDEVEYVSFSTFELPEGSAYPDFDDGKRHITFTVPAIGAHSLVTVGFRAQVGESIPADTVITNTAVISDGSETLSRSVAVTVESAPTAKILSPWQNQTITERNQFNVTGRVWTAAQSPEFPGTPVLDPIDPPSGNWYYVEWSAVDGALNYILEESQTPDFASATTFDPTDKLYELITDQANGTYYYRLKARNTYEDSFWSNVVSVTVTASSAALSAADLAPVAVTDYQPVVEVNIKKVGEADNWVAADSVVDNLSGDWWDWSFAWDVPQEDDAQYVVQVRAKDLAGNYDPNQVDTVTVTVKNGMTYVYLPIVFKRWPPVPFAPNISIDPDDGHGNYTVKWSDSDTTCPACDPTSYQLQESTDAGFGTITLDEQTTALQRVFTDKPFSTYYYRVRGINGYGAGEWSATVSPQFQGYSDDFSDVNSGWPREVYSHRVEGDDIAVFDVSYDDGSYRAKIMLDTRSFNNYSMGTVRAPWVNTMSEYEVQVDHRFARAGDQVLPPTSGKGGLVFGANDGYSTIFVVEWNYEGDCAVTRYSDLGSTVVDVRFADAYFHKSWGRCSSLSTGYDKHNLIKVVVDGNQATVTINGSHIDSFTDNGLSSARRVGLMAGSWERTPVDNRFDDFSVIAR